VRLSQYLVPAGLLLALSATPIGVAAADPVPDPVQLHCPARDAQQIDIIDGPITCDGAYQIVGQYTSDGEKYQQIEGFTCYTGNAMTVPVVLSCVSGDSDFAVNTVAPGQ
jgi:hypothetical protein